MKTTAQVGISLETTLAGVEIAKEAVKAIKKSVNGSSSALECMELETESIYQVTTYRNNVTSVRACNLKRITPLNIKVSVQFITPYLEVSWLAEGVIDCKSCIAKITTYATWKDGGYVWHNGGGNGTPEAPLATIYINEENMDN